MDTQPAKESFWRPRPSRLWNVFRSFTVLFFVLAVLYFAASQVAESIARDRRAQFAQRFGGITLNDFRPQSVPPEEDAGRVYRYAAALISKAARMYNGVSPYDLLTDWESGNVRRGLDLDENPDQATAEQWARTELRLMEPAFDLIREADALDQGSMLNGYDPMRANQELTSARSVQRAILARALVAAKDGNPDEALEWVERGFHFANTLDDEPLLIVQLVRIACIGLATETAMDVLNLMDQTLMLGPELRREMDRARDPRGFINTLAGEFAYAREQDFEMSSVVASTNEAAMLDLVFELVDTMAIEDAAARQAAFREIESRSDGSLGLFSFQAKLLALPMARATKAYFRSVAQCDLLEMSMALRAYKVAESDYPETLGQISPAYMDVLPRDPFTDDAYLYDTTGDGFVLYSVGPDLADNRGTQLQCAGDECGGDIVWLATR